MDFEIACGTVIRGKTEIVYKYLLQSDHWPSIKEVMNATGLPEHIVKSSFRIIGQQIRFAENRKRHFKNILD